MKEVIFNFLFNLFTAGVCSWLRQRMGDCHELGMEDLTLLEEEMDKAAKVVHERKVRLIICSYLYTSFCFSLTSIYIYIYTHL